MCNDGARNGRWDAGVHEEQEPRAEPHDDTAVKAHAWHIVARLGYTKPQT